MREFKHPNTEGGWKCPICKKSDDRPVTLIGIVGTEDGNNCEAEQFHVDCIRPVFDKVNGLIYQRLPKE